MVFALKKLVLFLVILSTTCSARADLVRRINHIINSPSQRKVDFHINVLRVDPYKVIYSRDAEEAVTPASNMKIIVTAAALKYLSPDYEYKTQVGLCGNNLVVIGSGDPLLADAKTDSKYKRPPGWLFDDIISKLKQNNITAIQDIVIDSSVFDDERVHPNWPVDELNRWYACEVSGLNFNGNCVELIAENVGGKIILSIEPQTNYIKLINKVKSINTGRGAVGAYRRPGKTNELVIKGKCRKKQGPVSVAIERPAGFFGFVLAEQLGKAGIEAGGQLFEKTIDPNCKFVKLAEYKTTLADCLKRCNKNSFGLAAESLAKTIAAENNPNRENGSWRSAQYLLSKYLTGLGINSDQFRIDDASGLSRKNKLSANAITTVLYSIYNSSDRQLYNESLAIAGRDGTIRRYFREEKYKGKILGKTGYINSVKSFSGICRTNNGDYIFSILTNKANGKTRKAINEIAKAIFDNG